MNIKEFTEKFLEQSQKEKIVAITGAGMSTASGIRDFRGDNGIYREKINAEDTLSDKYFQNNPKEFYEFYKKYLIISNDIKPNEGHYFLKNLENEGLLRGVITQNIDGLDLKAGISNVVELHGNGCACSCTKCHETYSIDVVAQSTDLPYCKKCNSILKPNIILYNELIDFYKSYIANEMILGANTLLIMGTKIEVNPISAMVKEFYISKINKKSNNSYKLFIINKGETDFDGYKDVIKYDGLISDFTEEYKRVRK